MVQGSFGFWFLPSFDHRCHLKSRVLPPLGSSVLILYISQFQLHPWSWHWRDLALVVQTVDNSIHGINHHPLNKYQEKWLCFQLDRDLHVSSGYHNPPFGQTEVQMGQIIIILINWDKVKEMVVAKWTLVYFCLLGNFANLKLYGYKIAPYFFFPLLVQFWTQKNSHLPYWFFHPASICEWRQGNCW